VPLRSSVSPHQRACRSTGTSTGDGARGARRAHSDHDGILLVITSFSDCGLPVNQPPLLCCPFAGRREARASLRGRLWPPQDGVRRPALRSLWRTWFLASRSAGRYSQSSGPRPRATSFRAAEPIRSHLLKRDIQTREILHETLPTMALTDPMSDRYTSLEAVPTTAIVPSLVHTSTGKLARRSAPVPCLVDMLRPANEKCAGLGLADTWLASTQSNSMRIARGAASPTAVVHSLDDRQFDDFVSRPGEE
jgi:hypothetical protein